MSKTLKMDKTTPLRNFLLNNFSNFNYDQIIGYSLEFPTYDLTAREYLQFAEYELLEMRNNSKLDFFKQVGVFNSFSLDRFNKVRNTMNY
ncbi:hypothetical protein ABE033_13615 [Priestia megaterium]